MKQSNTTEKNQSFQHNASDHGKENDTATHLNPGIPPRPPQKRKKTNQKVSQKKKGNKGSEVWHHFTEVEESELAKVTCNYCKRELAASGTNGTSGMWNHLDRCKLYPYRRQKNQKSITEFIVNEEKGDGKEVGNLRPLNVEEVRNALATMIIIDELPFKIVEGEGFQKYSRSLEPRFIVPSRNTVVRDCLNLYVKEKFLLKKIIKKYRVCLTTDTWTSIQNLNYMCLTSHWIDDDWLYQKKILNFQLVDSHAGRIIASSIEECLIDWGIESVFTVTVDNAISNDTCLDYLMKCVKWKDSILDNKYMHVRCVAHIVNLIVKEGLAERDKAIIRLRNVIRYVRSSPAKYSLFKKCVEKEKIICNYLVCLDVDTRWNSTYKMLEHAEKFEKAFLRMELDDPNYKKYFDGGYNGMCDERKDARNNKEKGQKKIEFSKINDVGNSCEELKDGRKKSVTKKKRDKKKIGPPKHEDFQVARCFAKFLKLFYIVTLKFSGSLYTTSNTFFRELVAIHSAIGSLSVHQDDDMRSMALKMMDKFDKYWSFNSKTNYLLFVAIVLDPRFKLDYVELCFGEMYGRDTILAKTKISTVTESLDELYNEYKKLYTVGQDKLEDIISREASHDMDIDECDRSLDFLDSQFAKRMELLKKTETTSEVTKYLNDGLVENKTEFDLLAWWKGNTLKFPILSKLAKDILAIPVSTVSSEQAFSTGGRVIDSFRSSLTPKIVEALICAQSWLRSTPIDLRESLDSIEKLEEIEEDCLNSAPTIIANVDE